MTDSEFLDTILGALLPSYESVMKALTISLEEVGKPIEIDSVIRILKSRYDKRRTQLTSQEEHHQKRCIYALIARNKNHTIETCWAKGGGKEGQGPKQKKRSKFKKKKGKEKVNAAKESSSNGKLDGSIAFINSNCAGFIKDSTGATVIIDMGVSSHMTPHQNLLKNYQSFPKPKTICVANKGTFDALGIGQLKLST